MTLFVVCLLTYAIKKTARDIWVIIILSVCIKPYVKQNINSVLCWLDTIQICKLLCCTSRLFVTSLLLLACTVHVSSPLVLWREIIFSASLQITIRDENNDNSEYSLLQLTFPFYCSCTRFFRRQEGYSLEVFAVYNNTRA